MTAEPLKGSQSVYNGHIHREKEEGELFCKLGCLEAFDNKSHSGLGK